VDRNWCVSGFVRVAHHITALIIATAHCWRLDLLSGSADTMASPKWSVLRRRCVRDLVQDRDEIACASRPILILLCLVGLRSSCASVATAALDFSTSLTNAASNLFCLSIISTCSLSRADGRRDCPSGRAGICALNEQPCGILQVKEPGGGRARVQLNRNSTR
jgi:hypothetical protein